MSGTDRSRDTSGDQTFPQVDFVRVSCPWLRHAHGCSRYIPVVTIGLAFRP
jgi:hypothetical protein